MPRIQTVVIHDGPQGAPGLNGTLTPAAGQVVAGTGAGSTLALGAGQYPKGDGTNVVAGTFATDVANTAAVKRVDPGTTGAAGQYAVVGPGGVPAWLTEPVFNVRHPRFGATGNGTTDDTTAIQAALTAAYTAGGGTVLLPQGTYKTTATLQTRQGVRLVGVGLPSSLVPASVSGPAVLTYTGSGNGTESDQYLGYFNIAGSATCAVAFAHCPNVIGEQITLQGFTGTDGYRFEYLWGGQFNSLRTNGATLTRASFKINKVVLDATWVQAYTSNLCDYNLYVDKSVTENSTGTATGFGNLQFHSFAAQGANVAGLGLIQFDAPISFTNLYTENCLSILQIGHSSVGSTGLTFTNCGFDGVRATPPYAMLLQKVSQVAFFGGQFPNLPIVIGNVTGDVAFFGPQRLGNIEFFVNINRTSQTSSAMPVSIYADINADHSRMVLKHTGYSWGFYDMAVNSSGAWVATAKSPTLLDYKTISALTASGTTATATATAHGYTTGNSATVVGASPAVYNGTFTITVVDANTFTYTLPSAPSVATAIGQPMVKV